MVIDSDRLWQAVAAQDARFDGWVFLGVKTTGIYCRPSCPARTPKRENVAMFATAAAAQAAGFRACLRCRPDASPGSPEWDLRSDLVARAMRLIADGIVDREGITGLASRLGYAPRHVHRSLVAAVGAGPLALARAQRAQTARTLIETTTLPITEIAFASGFRSVRQFNETIKEIFALTPTELRRRAATPAAGSAAITLRLPVRAPFDGEAALAFLGPRAVPGVEEVAGGVYRRTLRLPHGGGIAELEPRPDHVRARFQLDDVRDLAAAVQRCRVLLDLDSDPHAVLAALGPDPVIGALVGAAPGRRVIAHVDGAELAVRAVLGQQVSVAGARTVTGRVVRACGEPLRGEPSGGLTHLFPAPQAIATLPREELPMPRSRRRAVRGLAQALASGELVLDPGADRHQARVRLLELPGIGPWTAEYVAMRALRDPDAFPSSDLGVHHALVSLGQAGDPRSAASLSKRWRPYRAYALAHLWAHLGAGAERAAAA